jgi:hypothetical protein
MPPDGKIEAPGDGDFGVFRSPTRAGNDNTSLEPEALALGGAPAQPEAGQ